MLRPESWTGLAGGGHVPVGTGAPGSRPRFVEEIRRAERGVKSLFGGEQVCGPWRLKRLLIKKRGRDLRAGQADQWTKAWFKEHGLHQLSGTIRYPKAA